MWVCQRLITLSICGRFLWVLWAKRRRQKHWDYFFSTCRGTANITLFKSGSTECKYDNLADPGKCYSTLPMRSLRKGTSYAEGVLLAGTDPADTNTHVKSRDRLDVNKCTARTALLQTYSVPWRLSPATPPPASAEPADSEFFFRLELETFLRLVAPMSGLGSSSSSSLLLSFSQAGTALVDLSLKTRPELCGLDAAPLTSVSEAEPPDLGRLAPRSLSPLLGVTLELVAGVCSAALSSAGSPPLFTSSARSPAASITVRTLQPTSNSA